MALSEQAGEPDFISAQLLQHLSQSRYACTSLVPLATRPGNFVYRGVLSKPIVSQDGATARSVIIKHSSSSETAHIPDEEPLFEETLLKSIPDFSPPTTKITLIRTPRVYRFDRKTSTQVLEDFYDTEGFKSMLFSPIADQLFSQASLVAIGHDLGRWLRSFHSWASAPEQFALRKQMCQNDSMRHTKYAQTFGCILKVLQNYPKLLGGHEKTIESLQETIMKEVERPCAEEDEDWGLIQGDFWSGNLLLPSTPWQESTTSERPSKLFVIDWEFAQFGHRSLDLGQVIGDLYERKIYNKLDNVLSVMQGFMDGYGQLSEDMAFRTAIYIGVHLISWYNRRPRKGPRVAPPDIIAAGLTVGRDFIIKGWGKDRSFFEASALASMFHK